MNKIEQMTDKQFENILVPIWKYIAMEDTATSSDIIFVFGGLDMAIPKRAGELYQKGFAPVILVSGASGPFSKDVFHKSEALVFKDEMIKMGVPEKSIITEEKATNSLENVMFGMEILANKNITVNKAIVVAKSFMMRRAIATFEKQYPQIQLLACPPVGNIISFCDRSRVDFASRIIAELKRLELYGNKGDIAIHIPDNTVINAAKYLQTLIKSN